MRKVKKVSAWLSAALAILIILIGIAFYIASNVIQKDSVKTKIHSIISKKIGGEVGYESMQLKFFHRPHVLISKADFDIPDKASGSIEYLRVYPKILPLLYGNVEIAAVDVNSPDITIHLKIDEKTEKDESDERSGFSFDRMRQSISNALSHLNSQVKGIDVQVYHAKVVIKNSDQDFLDFTNLNGYVYFPDDVLSYQINAGSNVSQTIYLKGSVNTKSFDSNGNIRLKGFKPHLFDQYVVRLNDIDLESKLDVSLKYSSQKLEKFTGNLVLQNSDITLGKGNKKFKISCKKIDTDVYLDENKSVFKINNAEFKNPDVKASGEHHIDWANNKVNLSLTGTDINVGSSRDAVLFIAGGDKIVDLIFDVVRGGTVPNITLEASGENFKDMWKRDNFEIKGNMINGHIFVPVGDFDLTDVSGNAVIGKGRLEGTNLKARSGNSRGHDGTFIIGIEGPIGPLHLDIKVDADASEIPAIIKKFVDDETFNYELTLIDNIKGTASGELKVGETKKSPVTSVYVNDLDITADYKRVPEPINVKGNQFTFIDKSIDFNDLNVTIGNFNAPKTTGYYHWKEDKLIKLGTTGAKIDMSVLFPWLGSFEIIKPHLRHIDSMAGMVFFSDVDFSGPLSDSDKWEINAKGSVEKVDVNLEGFGSVMSVSDAEIESSSQDMKLSNASIKIKESIMKAGAELTDYFRDNLRLTLDFYGDMLAEEAELFSDYFSMPDELNFKSPISISDSSLTVQKIPDSPGAASKTASGSSMTDVDKELDLNMKVKAESLEWKDSEEPKKGEPEVSEAEIAEHSGEGKTSLNGKVVVESDNFMFKGFNWESVDAEVALLGDKIDVNVSKANLCGIATPGMLEVSSPNLKLDFETFTENEEFSDALKCLFDKAGIITGDFKLGGTINSEGEITNVVETLQGELELTSNGGRVSKYGGLARFFSALNFGEIFRGNNIDYEDEGFPYDFIIANADIKDGKLIIKEAAMDGPSLKVVCDGSVDLVNDTLDLQVLVIPVLAVDSVIEKIPLISMLLGKDVVSIPIKVTGDISDPKISQLSPYTIGAGLLGIIKQTLNIPVTLVKPLDSGKNKDNTGSTDAAGTPKQIESTGPAGPQEALKGRN